MVIAFGLDELRERINGPAVVGEALFSNGIACLMIRSNLDGINLEDGGIKVCSTGPAGVAFVVAVGINRARKPDCNPEPAGVGGNLLGAGANKDIIDVEVNALFFFGIAGYGKAEGSL